MNIGFGITGSFCTHDKALEVLKKLVDSGNNVIPIVTDIVYSTDTRFGKASDLIKNLESITGNKVVNSVVTAEPLGPKNLIDILAIVPCTSNTLSKLAHAITDNAVTMTAKAIMRNNKPVVIALATNDGLGLSLPNIATLMNSKNIYFVPFKQDNYEKKPKSLMANWDLTEKTILEAIKGNQLQPVLN